MDFVYGQLVEAVDICDRKQEVSRINSVIKQHGRAVVYGNRRYGKTSVLKNVILHDFAHGRNRLGLYVDLFQVNSIEDAEQRFRHALSLALSRKISLKKTWSQLVGLIKLFRIDLEIDPLTGEPKVSLAIDPKPNRDNLHKFFDTLRSIARSQDTLLIIDEFQDIVQIPRLESELRTQLQSLSKTTVILSGSKRHVLTELFSNESKPFYGFGSDIVFGDIPVNEWLPYMQERFALSKIKITLNEAKEICLLMEGVPNAIQELCQWLAMSRAGTKLNIGIIHHSLHELLESKASRYLERLSMFKEKEQLILRGIARFQPIKAVVASTFVHSIGLSASGIKSTITRFYDKGIIDRSSEGYRLVDPLFRLYLMRS